MPHLVDWRRARSNTIVHVDVFGENVLGGILHIGFTMHLTLALLGRCSANQWPATCEQEPCSVAVQAMRPNFVGLAQASFATPITRFDGLNVCNVPYACITLPELRLS